MEHKSDPIEVQKRFVPVPGQTRLYRRGAIYYFRAVVPHELRPFIRKTEMRKTLNTADFAKAKRLCHIESVIAEKEFAAARAKLNNGSEATPLTNEELYYLVSDWFIKEERDTEKWAAIKLPDSSEAERERMFDTLVGDAAAYSSSHEQPQLMALTTDGLADAFIKSRPDLAIKKGSDEYKQLGALLKKAKLESLNRRIGRLDGRASKAVDRDFSGYSAHSQPPVLPKKSITLKKLTERFMDYQKKNRSENTPVTYAIPIRTLLEVLGEGKPIVEITREDIQRVAEIFKRIPAWVSQRYPGVSVLKAIQMADTENNLNRFSQQTVSKYFNNLCAIFNFAKDHELLDATPAKGKLLYEQFRAKRGRKTTRRLFTVDELNSIFRAPLYTGCIDDRRDYAIQGPRHPRRGRFWVPLLALFHGCRLGEICQLYTEDVKEDEGIAYLSIRTQLDDEAETEKRLKTESSIRDVPIHPELLKLGFMRFVEERRKDKNNPRLFPELKLSKSTKRYSTCFSRWFSRFTVQSCGHKPKATFHSFRHHFRTALSHAGVGIEIVDELGGWVDDRRGMDRNYFHAILKQLADAIAKVKYDGLDLSHLLSFDSAKAQSSE